ncbi:MAG TPA: HAD-IA family hydrolase [Acidobacteriota bacterium]|nr:HAD-IA family hydrolase [Acidobacteriota bacterium]
MFDLDGTLADTGHDLADSVNFTRAHFALPPLTEKVVYANVGRGVEHLLKQSVPEQSLNRFQEVMGVFLGHYENHLLDRTVLYPGVREVLDYFRGKRRLVVSNKMLRLTLAVLRGLGLADEFDDILGGDSAVEKKPHPALLQLALHKFDVPAASALMVGDGEIDIEAGKRAGVITCGVTYGLGDPNQLAAAKPDVLIAHLSLLSDYFC